VNHRIEIETTSHPTRVRWACRVCGINGEWVKALEVRRLADEHEAQPVRVRRS
jgi:hypothetical protein